MAYRRLFILIEGSDDKRFCEKILKPVFEIKYDHVTFWEYAEETKVKLKKFLNSIEAMQADYVYLTDINHSPCISLRKQKCKEKHGVDENKIIVVIKEIESWYLAGLDKKDSEQLGLPYFSNTDNVIKEQFDQLIPEIFDSKIDFMLEILKRFSVEIAENKNKSFNYFLEKFVMNSKSDFTNDKNGTL